MKLRWWASAASAGFSAVGSAHPAGSAGCTTSQAVALNSAWLMLSEELRVTPTGDQQRRHAEGCEVGLERDDERAAAGHAHDGLHARIGSLDVRGVAPDLPGVAAGSSGESAEGAARVAQDACSERSARAPNHAGGSSKTFEISRTRSAILTGTVLAPTREQSPVTGRVRAAPSLHGNSRARGGTSSRACWLMKSMRTSSCVSVTCEGAATTKPAAAVLQAVRVVVDRIVHRAVREHDHGERLAVGIDRCPRARPRPQSSTPTGPSGRSAPSRPSGSAHVASGWTCRRLCRERARPPGRPDTTGERRPSCHAASLPPPAGTA